MSIVLWGIYLNKILVLLGVLLTIGVVTVSGCTSGSNTVNIQNMAFSPATVHIPGGTTVMWINNDKVDHEVVSDNGVYDSGVLSPGESFNYTFTQAGDYPYHCSIHPSMRGIIIVSSSTTTNVTNNTTAPTPVPYNNTPSQSTSNNPSSPSPAPSNPTTPAPSSPSGSGTGY